MGDQRTCAPLSKGANKSALWFQQTWSAPYLPGEEGALLLLKLMGDGGKAGSAASGSGGSGGSGETLGWVAIPCEELGEQHVQLHAPPLPTSAAEARRPRTPPLGAWVHCELALGVTPSHAAFTRRHPALVVQRSASSLKDGLVQAGSKLQRGATMLFRPTISPRAAMSSARGLSDESAELLRSLPSLPAFTFDAVLSCAPPAACEGPTPEATRRKLGQVLTAAAEAAERGEPELALQGYAAAFGATRQAPLLLLAANMLLRAGSADEAELGLRHVADEPSLSADQRSVCLAKLEQLERAREEAAPPPPPPPPPDGGASAAAGGPSAGGGGRPSKPPLGARRASVRHQVLDRQMLAEVREGHFGAPGSPTLPSPAPAAGGAAPVAATPHPSAGLVQLSHPPAPPPPPSEAPPPPPPPPPPVDVSDASAEGGADATAPPTGRRRQVTGGPGLSEKVGADL